MATSRSDPAGPSLRKDDRTEGAGRETRGRPFRRVLVANRGEIAVRIIRACHELGMTAVAVYSDADAAALHVRLADDAVRIGPPAAAESYLRIDAILEAASATGAEAIHPGYGFLAERAAFARAVTDAGLVFIGPAAATIDALGDKLGARRLARSVGVETVPGTLDAAPVDRPDGLPAILADAERIGFPAAGQGRGRRWGAGDATRRVGPPRTLPRWPRRRARRPSAFGDGTVYLEREILPARHIEVQLLGDETGQVVAIGERDCSIQRRHQKLVEESPAPGLTPRNAGICTTRRGSLLAAGLVNAATAEFLRGPDGVVLLPRGQHPAPGRARRDRAGHRARPRPGAVLARRGAPAVRRGPGRGRPGRRSRPATPIEVRISAEDPSRDFTPTPGRVAPLGHAVRAGRPRRHRPRGRGPDPARVRQPDGQDHGGRDDRDCGQVWTIAVESATTPSPRPETEEARRVWGSPTAAPISYSWRGGACRAG